MSAPRAGIVGAGGIGRIHLDCLRRLGVDVIAVSGSSEERSRELASELSVPAGIATGELITSDEIDVVHICTPNAQHASQVRMALEAGKHVVCEKPLATSVPDSEALLELAQQSGLVHSVAYNYRYYPLAQELRRAVVSGQLGSVHLVHGSYLLDEILHLDDGHWMLDPGQIGPALVLADVGVHWWDLLEQLTNQRVEEVFLAANVVRGGADTGEDSAALLMRLDHGGLASAVISNAAPGHSNSIDFELIGTKASAIWRQEDPDHLYFTPLGEATQLLTRSSEYSSAPRSTTLQLPAGQPQGYFDAFRDFISDVYRHVQGESDPTHPTFADGLRGVRILAALLQSAEQRQWVSV